MMGRKYREQANFFYEFRLDDMIPKGHLLRRINVFVTSVLGDLHEQLGPFYSAIGRPSIDPEFADPDAYRWLLLRHSLREEAVRGSKTPPRIQVVLPARSQCRDSPPLYVLREPVEPVP